MFTIITVMKLEIYFGQSLVELNDGHSASEIFDQMYILTLNYLNQMGKIAGEILRHCS
jgi:hypothetical protein